jgi:glutathione S-transferase
MLKVWGRASSFNVQKAMWTIGELGLEAERIDAGGRFGGLDTPEYRAMNPNGRIPVLKHDEVVVWESHSIVRYLAATFGRGTLWPEDPAERSLTDRWMDWTAATLQPAFMDIFWGYYRTPEPERDWTVIQRGIDGCARLYGILDRHLAARPFVAGEHLTLGDIPVGATLYRYFELDLPRPSLPNVEAYYARLQDRLAYRLHVMIPFDELKGHTDY